MPTANRVMFAQIPTSVLAARHIWFKMRSPAAKRAFGRKEDPLVLLERQYLDAVVSAFRDREKRKLERRAPYRLLRSLTT